MDIIETLQQVLDIPYPFKIERVERDIEIKEIHIYMVVSEDYQMGLSWTKHSYYDRTWEHLNLFQYRCFIHCKLPVYRNKDTQKTQAIEVPFASYKKRFTHEYEKRAIELLSIHLNFTQVARQLKIRTDQVIGFYESYTRVGYQKQEIPLCTSIGIDETSTRKGHNYITIFTNMETGDILDITDGRSSQAIKDFFDAHPRPSVVENISMDMSPAFIKGCEDYFSYAKKTYDKWHVCRLVFRHLEVLLRKHKKDALIIEKIHFFANEFQSFYDQQDFEQANAQLAFLIDFIEEISSKNSLAKSLKKNFKGIVQYFKSKLTNGLMEGINSKIQAIKRNARGFRYVENFKKFIFFAFGAFQPSKSV